MIYIFIGFFIVFALLAVVSVSLNHTMTKMEQDFYDSVPSVSEPVRTTAQLRTENAAVFAKKRFTVLRPTDTLGTILPFRGKSEVVIRNIRDSSD